MQYFEKLLELIKIEKDEDQQQYYNQMVLTPLNERKKKGVTWYPILVKDTEIGSGENYYLSLERTTELNENHSFQVGDMVSLFNNTNSKQAKKANISGVITYVKKNAMRIGFSIDELPEWVEYGSLGVDLLFDAVTYKEMDEAIRQVVKTEDPRLIELRDILLGKKKAYFSPEAELPDYYQVPSLNESQNDAIKNILRARDVAIIHGPPGTGKTTTMVSAIKMTLERENQVLVTAPSNTAVDLLTKRLLAKGVSVIRIGNPARVNEDLIPFSLEAQIAQHPDYKLLKKLRRDAEEYKKMAAKYKRNFGREEREQRKLLFAEASKLKHEAYALEKYIVDSLLNHTQVITATLVGSVNRFIRYRRFSTVFIDEAAQALEPACWIPIIKSERVIFAGDHCQLPPTIKSYEAAKGGLTNTLFEQVIQKQEVDVMLDTQYRMHEHIMQFSNQEFYQGDLKAAETVVAHKLFQHAQLFDDPINQAVEFIDTAGCGFDEKTMAEGGSKYNRGEADILMKHWLNLAQQIQLVEPEMVASGHFSAGIISPYQAQVKHIRERLHNHPDLVDIAQWLDINSVDGFQGQERDVIYISLVRSNDKGKIGFLEDTRRMNVALTRARKKLIVIGDSGTLGQNAFYQHFLDYIDQIGAYRSAWEWMGE
ncbi:DNA-binding protein [marine bacterium AO1-C]|nr:DNA-binding protein [marine bacterium AO1-C]